MAALGTNHSKPGSPGLSTWMVLRGERKQDLWGRIGTVPVSPKTWCMNFDDRVELMACTLLASTTV